MEDERGREGRRRGGRVGRRRGGKEKGRGREGAERRDSEEG